MYEIQTEDFYKDISKDVKDRFDTSDYTPNHRSGIPSGFNKKVLGMFKDEVMGKVIDEFVGLRAKLYSFKMFEGEETKKCKGIKKSVVKKNITHEDYKKCLFTGDVQLREMSVIRSYKHVVYAEVVNKIALCSIDDKRYIQEGQTDTLALQHYKIFSLGKLKKKIFYSIILKISFSVLQTTQGVLFGFSILGRHSEQTHI